MTRALLRLALLFTLAAPGFAGDASAAPPDGVARIHYHRPRGDYGGWGLHAWEDASVSVQWTSPLPPSGTDAFGVYWDVPLKPGVQKLGFLVHQGDRKDPGVDQFLDVTKQREAWLVSGRADVASAPPDVAALAFGDLTRSRAHWIDRSTILWPGAPANATYGLATSREGTLKPAASGVAGGTSLVLAVDPAGPTAAQRAAFPYLANARALRLEPSDPATLRALLRGQLAVWMRTPDGTTDATGVQVAGVLDDLCASDAPLGATWRGGAPTLRVWAPTAQRVRLLRYAGPRTPQPVEAVDMADSNGVWSATGAPAWKDSYYRYEVTVWTPSTNRVETITATDPYSRALARNSERSLLVDLADRALAPAGWDTLVKPPLAAPEDAVVYELHVRDFSATDATVPDSLRGTYLAFTRESAGTRHLRTLARAGVTHVHLLPAFDYATVDEDRTTWDSGEAIRVKVEREDEVQAAIANIVHERDGFNWGYDPLHYGVPEGGYSTRPDGAARTIEFRRMVQALSRTGLRTVMDVVYNHTHAAGLDRFSVLDRIVPGYYQRLNLDGAVENSTCCANTASEHRMMEKLMVDDVVHWARDYKVDGFRFDLMGHHLRRNLEAIRAALDRLTPERDGVDGRAVLLYGEGWDFGEVSQNQRGVNATQKNLAGSGVGTFNDRLRDAVRGGSPFADRREPGFASGLAAGGDRTKLFGLEDRIRVGLTGNLAAYAITDANGRTVTGAALAGTGYAADPQECINYVEAHDNETLWDKLLYAAPAGATAAELARMQALALSVPALAQGIPFFHAGGEILRTKSLDADSYDSGDWFNRIDWTHTTNYQPMGVPPRAKNGERWPIIRERLGRAELVPKAADIEATFGAFQDLLAVRRGSALFRLRTAEDVQRRVGFLNTGPAQVPGVIVMTLSDALDGAPDLDPRWSRIAVVFNATPGEQRITYPAFAQIAFELHPAQANGHDPVVRTAHADPAGSALVVPGRTTAVFVAR